jgi:rubredoxin
LAFVVVVIVMLAAIALLLVKILHGAESPSLLCRGCGHVGTDWKAVRRGPVDAGTWQYEQQYECPQCGRLRVITMFDSELGARRVRR